MSENLLDGFRSHERWLAEALREAELAAAAGEVPVGAVVVRAGTIPYLKMKRFSSAP